MYTITLKDIKFIIKVLVCHILAITTITKLNKRPTDLDGHPSTTAHRRICQRVTCLHFKLHLWVLTVIDPRLLWLLPLLLLPVFDVCKHQFLKRGFQLEESWITYLYILIYPIPRAKMCLFLNLFLWIFGPAYEAPGVVRS